MAEQIIPKRRLITEKGNLIEIVAWKVPKSKFYLEGVKYSFAFIHKEKRLIAFDNFNNEGHHKHYLSGKESYEFQSLEETADKFFSLVEEFESKQGDGND